MAEIGGRAPASCNPDTPSPTAEIEGLPPFYLRLWRIGNCPAEDVPFRTSRSLTRSRQKLAGAIHSPNACPLFWVERINRGMSSNPRASATPIRVFQEERIAQRVDEIVDRLKGRHAEIEEVVSRLLRCLAAIGTVERSVDAMASVVVARIRRRALRAKRNASLVEASKRGPSACSAFTRCQATESRLFRPCS